MGLLPSTTLASSVVCAKASMVNLSEIIGKYLGDSAAKEFLDSCKRNDFIKANDILDRTVKELTGFDSVSLALNIFADKFPQIPQLRKDVASAFSESEKVRVISSYSSQIISIIDGKC